MINWKKACVLIIAGGFLAGCSSDFPLAKEFQGLFESSAVSGRKALMRSISKSWKAVRDAAKAGNSDAAAKAASSLAKNARKISKAFAKKDMDGATRALPAVWSNKAKFNINADSLAAAAEAYAQIWAKSSDKAQAAAALKRIGANCGGCHKEFRAKKKS